MLKRKKVVNSEYHFKRCLGEGLSSTVFEAIRSNSSGIQGETVAVKVLKSENSVSWLQNEFESLRKVSSPYCVRVLGHEAFEDGPALILEFVDGVTLFELGRNFQLNAREIKQIEIQVHKGLLAIQSAGCFHGDLNPKNILVTCDGIVKLIDFGSFTYASSENNQLIGSLPYISENIWQGDAPSFESDCASWALIAEDLRTCFARVPLDKESARKRARELNFSILEFNESTGCTMDIAAKVKKLIAARADSVSTAIISRNSDLDPKTKRNWALNIAKRKFFAGAVAAMCIALLFPAQSLLSEPLKAAEPAILLVRTHAWTELNVNGIDKGYAPLNLNNLPPGKYRIQYKRPRGSGELTLHLNPGQRRLLRDSDFKD